MILGDRQAAARHLHALLPPLSHVLHCGVRVSTNMSAMHASKDNTIWTKDNTRTSEGDLKEKSSESSSLDFPAGRVRPIHHPSPTPLTLWPSRPIPVMAASFPYHPGNHAEQTQDGYHGRLTAPQSAALETLRQRVKEAGDDVVLEPHLCRPAESHDHLLLLAFRPI